ncbi:MAG: ATP-dependent protease subunit HslV [Calditrichaeota bacterium]|nr:ATP-dependent protease subunit HslV [Calditrichota bacterium]RQW07810.1 MAG: ATP-dependent protease subunit HslV [Calditrichota bacterium]
MKKDKIRSTTVLGIVHNGQAAIAGDGQVTFNNTVLKHGSVKIRRLYDGKILAGFAGASADAFALFEKFEEKLHQYNGNLTRAAVEMTKEWRMDKFLRRLEAMLAVLDKSTALILSGTGDVVEPDDRIVAIGSGGPFALAAARALVHHTKMDAREIVEKSMQIASEICIYTNNSITIETIE